MVNAKRKALAVKSSTNLGGIEWFYGTNRSRQDAKSWPR